MSQEIEIEFKNLLTEEEYTRLFEALPFPIDSILQTNYYFETKSFDLRKQGSALRIREKNGKYRLTLKEPHPQGLLETHDALTEKEAKAWMEGKIIPKPNISKQLKQKHINIEDVQYYGALTTERRETTFKHTLLVLDKSTYNGKTDFELEIEAKDRKTGEETFAYIMETYQIMKKETPNKIARFFYSLKK